MCIWEEAFSLHEGSGVTWVEKIKDAICIDPHRSFSWTNKWDKILGGGQRESNGFILTTSVNLLKTVAPERQSVRDLSFQTHVVFPSWPLPCWLFCKLYYQLALAHLQRVQGAWAPERDIGGEWDDIKDELCIFVFYLNEFPHKY